MRADETLTYLFKDGSDELKSPVATWLAESRRFAVFAELYRDKIRKKIRVTQDPGATQDLHHELETAYLLVREKQFSVAYEPYVRGGGRPFGPDFSVTYTTSFTFNVEATRLRGLFESDSYPFALGEQNHLPVPQLIAERLSDITCNKLYQLMPNMMNVVVIGVDSSFGLTESHVAAAMSRLRQRAESGDANLFERHGFRDASAFFKYYERLSSIVVRPKRTHMRASSNEAIYWTNRQGKHAIPAKGITLLQR